MLVEPTTISGKAMSQPDAAQKKRLDVPKPEDRLENLSQSCRQGHARRLLTPCSLFHLQVRGNRRCSHSLMRPVFTGGVGSSLSAHSGHNYCSSCLLAAMLQSIARSDQVYDLHRPDAQPRGRRGGQPPMPTHRNRKGQLQAWQPHQLTVVIACYRRESANRTRAVQAKAVERSLQEQVVERSEWAAIIEAAGYAPLPALHPHPRNTSGADTLTLGRVVGQSRMARPMRRSVPM